MFQVGESTQISSLDIISGCNYDDMVSNVEDVWTLKFSVVFFPGLGSFKLLDAGIVNAQDDLQQSMVP